MAVTRPTTEQLRFTSAKTGEHSLDTYLENAELGDRQLSALVGELFDSSGVMRSDQWDFKYDISSSKFQVRVGGSSASYTDITSFFNQRGTFSSSNTYQNFDMVVSVAKDTYIVSGLTSGSTFADEAAFIASANTKKIVDTSEARQWAIKTDGAVESTNHSAKAWAIGGTGVTDTAAKGAAKEWATETSGTVDGTSFSSKEYAQGTQASTGGSAKDWAQDTDQVNGATTNDRSSKAWAQGASMTGATLGGSSKDWAQTTSGTIDGTNYSAKEYAQGSQASTGGSAKDWAQTTSGTVDGTSYSSKEYAQGTQASTGGSAKDWAQTTSSTVDGTGYSSKEYAQGTQSSTGGSSKGWAQTTSSTVDGTGFSAKEYAQGTQASTGGSAKNWAQDSDQVNGATTNDRSAKAWAQGASMTGATLGGSSKDWAQTTGGTVDGTDYSSKEYAIGTTVAAGSSKEWATTAEDTAVSGGEFSAKHYSAKSSASATASAGSATTALGHANTASGHKDTATTQAGTSTTKAGEAAASALAASNSATSASNAQTAAESARDSALSAYDNFDDRYLGEKSSNPSVDNDGNTLVGGTLYFNGTTDKMMVWTGSAWVETYADGSTLLPLAGGTMTGAINMNNQNITSANSVTAGYINLTGKILTITGDTDDTFKITAGANGSTTLATVDTAGALGELILDADGRIRLDAGDPYGVTHFANNGTNYASFHNSGTAYYINNLSSNGDIIIQGRDSSATPFTALTLDMSEAGKAIFNAGATFANDVTVENINLSDKVLTITGDTNDTFTITTGGGGVTTLATTDAAGTGGHFLVDADGYIRLTSGSTYGEVFLNKDGTNYGEFFTGGTDFWIRANQDNQPMKFAGKDGGTYITALTLDMSAAGAATFNNDVNAAWGNDRYIRMYYDDSYHMGLHLEADTRDTILYSKSADGSGDIRFKTGSGPSEKMTLLAGGNVGIGKTSPSTKLHVDVGKGSAAFNKGLILESGDGSFTTGEGPLLEFHNEDVKVAGVRGIRESGWQGGLQFFSHTSTSGNTYGTTFLERMRISGNGNVGIGTTAPSELLHISSAGDANIKLEADTGNTDENANPKIELVQDGGQVSGRLALNADNKLELYNQVAGQLVFGTSNTERMRIQPTSGNVGINNTAPTSTLHVTGDATVDDINLNGKVLTITGDDGDTFSITTGAAGVTTLATTDAAGSDGRLILNADGMIDYVAGDLYNQHRFFGGSMSMTIMPSSGNSGTDAAIRNNTSDSDLVFRGNDGGSYITALKLDMSEGGNAIFNGSITAPSQEYTSSLATSFSQVYNGDAQGAYFVNGDYQKVLTVTPSGPSQNYTIYGRISTNNGGSFHKVNFVATLRSNTLPDLAWQIYYDEQFSSVRYFNPLLWTKETTTAGFVLAFQTLATIYGNVDVDIDVITRDGSSKDNLAMNTVTSSDQLAVDTGFTSRDMTLVTSVNDTGVTTGHIKLDGRAIRVTGDTDDTFTITSGANGATTLATVDTAGDDGHLTLNPDGHIILDSGDEYGSIDIKRQGGNTYASLFSDNNTSGNLYIRNNISNADIKIVGNDGGTFFNALAFDMSNAGAATFSGDVTATGNVTAYSMAEAKESIETIINPLELVEKLRGVSFNWKDRDEDRKTMGFVYEEVDAAVPELARSDEDGRGSVMYQNTVAVLVEAVKSLSQRVKELEAK